MAKSSLVEGAGRNLRLLDNPKRSANFAVLKAPDVPSVLIETGFLSNERDEELLRDQSQRRRIADVLSRELAEVLTSAPFA
jgi:N-acetylmuramoyl-L-alanine amidase